MIEKKVRHLATVLLVASTWFVAATSHAVNVNLTSGNDCVQIGAAVWGGVAGVRPAACINDTTMVALRSDSLSGPLNQTVAVNGLAGEDSIVLISSNGLLPPTNCDCQHITTVDQWQKIAYDGHVLDVNGGDDFDVISGGRDSGDTWASGDGGFDIVYNFSTVGRVFGGAGTDGLVSDTASGSDGLFGEGDSNDCLWDKSNSVITNGFDCGSGSDRNHSSNTSIQANCEDNTATCCGICI
jgi:hypothetical protein